MCAPTQQRVRSSRHPTCREMLDAEYVLPVKSAKSLAHTDLTPYLEQLSSWMDVTVVDGSAEDVFQKHSQCWAGMVRHCRPISWPGRNG
ncbi:MAG TPA: hypothetical protein VGP24_11595, partial [Glaciihabitans sp.]|nr:hypothetical protein [Glaciihabitans sp.]